MTAIDLQKKVGQLFAVGFHGYTPSLEIKTLIRDYGVGGIVLFKRNVLDAVQLQSLTFALQEEARLAGHEHPLFIGIDQENGQVARITPPIFPQIPGPMALGATHSPELAYQAATVTGEMLRYFGINMNYAPVCDINSEPLNPVIGVRSPGDDPEFVGRFASAASKGLREQRVVPSVKHFPGHGDTAVDSHYGLPVIPKSREQMEQCELIPFRRAVAEDIEAVMTAHIALPAITGSNLPATLSSDIMNILRNDMKYDGMIITDCLEMDGIRATYGTEKGSVLALEAGCDSIMICHTHSVQQESMKQICEAVQSGKIPISRLDEAYNRVTRLKSSFLSWDSALLRQDPQNLVSISEKGAILAKEAYSLSATLVRDQSNILPLSGSPSIVFLFPEGGTSAGGAVDGEGLASKSFYHSSRHLKILQSHNQSVVETRYGPTGLSAEQLNLIDAADTVIFTSINARESPYQKALGLELLTKARSVIHIAACSPYDFIDDPSVKTYITLYEPTVEAFAAAADVIFGTSPAKGVLPVGARKVENSIQVSPLNVIRDLTKLERVWNAALPTYPLSAGSLEKYLVRPNAHHLVARIGSSIVGFCLVYATTNPDTESSQLAVIAVDPEKQGKGVGTALIREISTRLRKKFNPSRLEVGSSFPRFWPGIPTDLPSGVLDFFIHRGFRIKPPVSRSVDLYQDITDFKAPEKYASRAKEQGYSFAALQSEQYEECLAGQKRNFSYNPAWVDMYFKLNPAEHPDSIMVAFDAEGKQVGWTLMLPPSSNILQENWALPPLCGPKTGLIGCVGVDESCRKAGVGLALLSHAMENMKLRGIEGVFVDWVALEGYYEKVGFQVWRSYRTGAM